MKLVSWHDTATGERRFVLTISEEDYIRAEFGKYDKPQIDYFNRDDATIEESLMGLQLIARRIEETTP